MNHNQKLEELFYRRFNDLDLSFVGTKQLYNVRVIRPSKKNIPFDFAIEIGRRVIGIVEVRESRFLDRFDYFNIEKYASENSIRYIVLTDNERYIIRDQHNKSFVIEGTFDDFVREVTKKNDFNPHEVKVSIANKIRELIELSPFSELNQIMRNFYQNSVEQLEFDEISGKFSFISPTDINSTENRLFRWLLKDDKPITKIFRYTSLSTIFSMLNFNSFRMNCLVGMNDITEVNYAETYITGVAHDFTNAKWQTVDAYNRRFISSCSLKEDDLTQWRLYAEDSKGACLVYRINDENANNEFLIKKISYGRKDKSHPELDFVKDLINKLKTDLDVDFDLKTLSVWRHFFKPYDYAIEEEVRILYIQYDRTQKKGWLLTNSHQILNPFVEFRLNQEDSPMQLIEIVLGPKCPEKEINKKQLEQFIRELRARTVPDKSGNPIDEYNVSKLRVKISEIQNYR